MNWLVGKFGFDEHLWRELEPRQQNWLAMSSVLAMLSCLLFAIGGGYFAFVSAHGHGTQWFIALFIFSLTFIIAFNFRRLFVLMGGYPLHQQLEGLELWRPKPVRLVLITLMATFFSQPLALFVTQSIFEKDLNDRIELKINFFEFAKKTELKTRIDAQTLEILRLQDGLSRLPISTNSANTNFIENAPIKNNRKALLIGGSNYKYYSILKNVTNDINGMKKMLQDLGFDVVVTLDEGRDQILSKLIDHTRNLNAGDISLVFYAGHGMQFRGRNYIIPVDFPLPLSVQALRTYGIDANDYVEKIDDKTPRFNLVMLDACREFIGSTEQGLAKIETEKSKNTIIMLAAAPGKLALDGVGKNSPFTEAVLKNFPKQEDFSKVVSYITRDVNDATNGSQKPVSTVSLIDVDFRLPKPIPEKIIELPSVVAKNSSPNEICSDGDIESRQRCISTNVRLLDNRKKSLENAMLENVPSQVAKYRQAINESGVLTDRWQILWQNKILAAIVSIIFVVLLVSGDFMRDIVWLSPLRSYEKLRHVQAKQFVKARFDEMRIKTAHELLLQNIVPSEVFQRWDPVKNFYSVYQKAKSSDDLVVVSDQNSWNELVQKLNQQERVGG